MTNNSNIDIETLARRIVELGGNAGVTQRCVPLASGGLNPDWRVNYEFGLVLGVDEFRQEQFYHLQRDYLHHRALHGYGVVSGLEISPERTSDNDIRINVGTGVGVDQCGRTFVVRSDQCAYLRAWLERNRANVGLENGDLSLFVVGTYDECKDALVAIAGQPCASSEQSLAPSRIRDSFNITLSTQPPAMPAWTTIRRLASLMTRVRIINGLPEGDSDEAAITERVRVIDDPARLAALDASLGGYYGADVPDYWKLPAEEINLTLDRIFMVWVTEVRPRLAPAVISGCDTSDPIETGILLGRLDLQIGNANAPIEFSFADDSPAASYDERPYLMQTQLIQELLFLGVGNERKPSRLFGSLFVQDDENLVVWVHHPETLVPADAAGALEVLVNGRRVPATIGTANRTGIRARNVFLVNVADNIPAAARVEVRLVLAGWRVAEDDAALPELVPIDGGELPVREIVEAGRTVGAGRNILDELRRTRLRTGGTTPLLASIDQFAFEYAGREGDTITLYAFAERLPEVREFVVATRLTARDVPRIRLWFPFDAPRNLDDVRGDDRALVVSDSATGQVLVLRIEATDDRHVWMLVADVGEGPERAAELRALNRLLSTARLVLTFDASMITVDRAADDGRELRSLLAAMTEQQYSYTGFDGAFIRVPFVPQQPQAAPQSGLTEADVIRIILENRQPPVPIVPLADLQFRSTNADNIATFELWFHFDLEWQRYNARVADDFTLLVLAEVIERGRRPELVRLNFERSRVDERPNVFRIDVFSDGAPDRLQYLRFVFPVSEQLVVEGDIGGFGSLEEYMKNTRVRFENYYDVESFTERPAVVLYGRATTRG